MTSEREKARKFWNDLAYSERWELGDQLVLGDLDVLYWFGKRPTKPFLDEIDYQRILWEDTKL